MNSGRDTRDHRQADRVRQIPVWAQRYAQNRTLSIIVFFLVIALSVVVLAGLAHAAVRGREAGDSAWAALFAILAAGVFAWILWFRFVAGRRISGRIAEALYRDEGSVWTEPMEEAQTNPQAPCLAHFLLLFCVLSWFALFLLNIISIRQLLPTSAAYMVPFLFYFYGVRYRGVVSPFMLLWPALYGIHALMLALSTSEADATTQAAER